MKQVNFKIEEYQHEKLHEIAWKRRISMNELIKNMIDELEEDEEDMEDKNDINK